MIFRANMMRFLLATGLVATGPVVPNAAHAQQESSSQQQEKETVLIQDAWARATPAAARTGAAYMTLVNTGSENRTVVKATGDVAEQIELHKIQFTSKGVMRMREVDTLPVPADEVTALKPGSWHIMLINLAAPLEAGDTFDLTLHFADGEQRNVQVTVK